MLLLLYKYNILKNTYIIIYIVYSFKQNNLKYNSSYYRNRQALK